MLLKEINTTIEIRILSQKKYFLQIIIFNNNNKEKEVNKLYLTHAKALISTELIKGEFLIFSKYIKIKRKSSFVISKIDKQIILIIELIVNNLDCTLNKTSEIIAKYKNNRIIHFIIRYCKIQKFNYILKLIKYILFLFF